MVQLLSPGLLRHFCQSEASGKYPHHGPSTSVSASASCYSKIPRTRGLKQQTSISHSSGGRESEICVGGSWREPPPDLQTATRSYILTWRERDHLSGGSSQKGTNPIMAAPPPTGPHISRIISPRPQRQIPSQSGVRASR